VEILSQVAAWIVQGSPGDGRVGDNDDADGPAIGPVHLRGILSGGGCVDIGGDFPSRGAGWTKAEGDGVLIAGARRDGAIEAGNVAGLTPVWLGSDPVKIFVLRRGGRVSEEPDVERPNHIVVDRRHHSGLPIGGGDSGDIAAVVDLPSGI